MDDSKEDKKKSISRSDILTVAEAADLLKVSKDTIRAACDARKLPFRKIGRMRRFPAWLLIDWLDTAQKSLEEGVFNDKA